MAFEGMDVDQAQSLARRLDANAQGLAHLTAALTALTAELGRSWLGPASATFQQQWSTRHRAALTSAAQALADMHAHLTANIQQQVRASVADGASNGSAGALAALGAGLLSFGEGVWNVATSVDSYLDPLEKLDDLAGKKFVTGRYNKTWTRLMQLDHDSPLLHYKKSPVLHWLHDDPLVQGAGKVLKVTHIQGLLERAGPIGTVIGLVTFGQDVLQGGTDLSQHRYAGAGGDLIDATADGLKALPDPPLILLGGTIALLKEDYDIGSQIDWSQIPNPLQGDTFREDYVPEFKSLPGQVVGAVMKAFS